MFSTTTKHLQGPNTLKVSEVTKKGFQGPILKPRSKQWGKFRRRHHGSLPKQCLVLQILRVEKGVGRAPSMKNHEETTKTCYHPSTTTGCFTLWTSIYNIYIYRYYLLQKSNYHRQKRGNLPPYTSSATETGWLGVFEHSTYSYTFKISNLRRCDWMSAEGLPQ